MAAKKTIKRRKANYLNNKDLLAATIESLEQDRVSDTLAKMLMLLVERISQKGNFNNYTYLDDMKAYALMMHMRTFRSFKPERSNNAFAFFTQCTTNSFIQFLNKERRQRDIRDEMLVKQGMAPSHTYANANSKPTEDEEDFYKNQKKKTKKQLNADHLNSLVEF
jgi:DNA-directed RNA polymerase specialized sigma24 family protein